MTGKVYLVGAGPCDAGLLTLRGAQLLQTADVVIYDALVGPAVLRLIPDAVRRIDVGKRAGNHPVPQEEINRILLCEAQNGNRVVRLKGGDPFLFGRGGEELELLQEYSVPFEVVPGVPSAFAVPAYAGIPVTHRGLSASVHVITAHRRQEAETQCDYAALARLDGTLVFLMGVGAMAEICGGLRAAGMADETPAAVLERGTSARQRRVVATLATLPQCAAAEKIEAPAIIVVGQVCALAERFCWAEKRPLGGRRVIVTRPRARASRLAALLCDAGAEVLELPSIATRRIVPNDRLDAALSRMEQYGWLVFTSPAGVDCFFAHLREKQVDIRCIGAVKIAAIGSATAAALMEHGLIPALVPAEYSAAALGKALAQQIQADSGTAEKQGAMAPPKRAGCEPAEEQSAAAFAARQAPYVLLARAREASPDLCQALAENGIPYEEVPLYETFYESCPDADTAAQMLHEGGIDYAAFTSASTVRGFAAMLGDEQYPAVHAVCIGESTARAAREYGMKTAVADKATIEAVAEKILELEKGSSKWN